MKAGKSILAAAVVALVSGCGYKGPLTLPEKTGPVTIRPAAANQQSGASAPGETQTTPPTAPEAEPATPAPDETPPPQPTTEDKTPGG